MAKSELKIKARKMRRSGKSVKTIAQKLGIAKSTASLWVRDIILSVSQLEKLRKSMIKGSERGRLKGALMQKERRLKLIRDSQRKGIKKIGKLSKREFLIAGLALYWGEGTKKNRRQLRFTNSDPKMITFMLKWFREMFGVKDEGMKLIVGINEIHRKREKQVLKYWSAVTNLPLCQFRKVSFKKVKNHKVYENFNQHFGTLTIDILKPARFYYKIVGLIEALGMPA